jgi:hypothetical protein
VSLRISREKGRDVPEVEVHSARREKGWKDSEPKNGWLDGGRHHSLLNLPNLGLQSAAEPHLPPPPLHRAAAPQGDLLGNDDRLLIGDLRRYRRIGEL